MSARVSMHLAMVDGFMHVRIRFIEFRTTGE